LYKTNELAYYRLVENFKNDDVKMTRSGDNIFISKKGKTFVKLMSPRGTEVIGAWMEEIDEFSSRLLLQFDKRDLHCYKIGIRDGSTEITYLFRLTPGDFGFSGLNVSDGELDLINGAVPHKIVNVGERESKEGGNNKEL
jgi:hypothetical protein